MSVLPGGANMSINPVAGADAQTAEMLISQGIMEHTGGRVRNLHVLVSVGSAHVEGQVSSDLVKRMADQAATDAIHALADLIGNPEFQTAVEIDFAVDDAEWVCGW